MNKIKKFLDSNLYIATIFIFTIICWWFRIQIVAISVYMVFCIAIILLDVKRVNIITLVFAAIINYRVARLENNLVLMLTISSITAPIIIYDLLKSKVKYKSEIFISMLIFTGANILSLVNTNKDTIGLGLAGVGQFMACTLIFLYFYNKKEKGDFHYVAKNALVMGLAIAIELALHLYRIDGDIINKSSVDLGWGLSNFIAITVTVLIPLTLYLYIENQKRKYVLLTVVIELWIVAFTFSKGAILGIGLMIIPLMVMTYIYAKDKKVLIKDSLFAALFILLGIVVVSQVDSIWQGFQTYFKSMDGRGWFNDSSRITIYKEGLRQFKLHPMFGAGSYTGQYYLDHNIHYHNYIIQTLATVGLVGLLTFTYYIYTVVKKCLVKNYFNICILFIVIAMLIHGLVDTTWYNPIVMVMLSISFPFLVDKEPKVEINLV